MLNRLSGHLKLTVDDQLRAHRSESLKQVNSPAKVWQRVMNKKKEKSRTY
jgi:cAMP-dependent protein kinase regulator